MLIGVTLTDALARKSLLCLDSKLFRWRWPKDRWFVNKTIGGYNCRVSIIPIKDRAAYELCQSSCFGELTENCGLNRTTAR
jgi:hypothetical protein